MNELQKIRNNLGWTAMINRVTKNIHDRYATFIDKEEARSASCLGIWMAALDYDKNKSKTKSIGQYIYRKGCYFTVDILRSDKCIPRKQIKNKIIVDNNYYADEGNKNNTLCNVNFDTYDTRFDYNNFIFEWSDGLDDREKSMFKMRFVEGIEWKDIATKHGVTSTHMSRLHIALKIKLQMLFLTSIIK